MARVVLVGVGVPAGSAGVEVGLAPGGQPLGQLAANIGPNAHCRSGAIGDGQVSRGPAFASGKPKEDAREVQALLGQSPAGVQASCRERIGTSTRSIPTPKNHQLLD